MVSSGGSSSGYHTRRQGQNERTIYQFRNNYVYPTKYSLQWKIDKKLITKIASKELEIYQSEPDYDNMFCLQATLYKDAILMLELQLLSLPTNVSSMNLRGQIETIYVGLNGEEKSQDSFQTDFYGSQEVYSKSLELEIDMETFGKLDEFTLNVEFKIIKSRDANGDNLHWKWSYDKHKEINQWRKYYLKHEKKKPFDLNCWLIESKRTYTSCDLYSCLEKIGYEEYYPLFIENGIEDKDILRELGMNELKEIGIGKIGHRTRIFKEIIDGKDDRY